MPLNDFGFPTYVIAGNGQSITVNDGNADAFGTRWFCEDVEGVDSPDRRVQMSTRVSEEGETPADLHYRGRTFIFRNGWAESPTETARESSRLLMAQATDLNLSNTGLLTLSEVVPKQAIVVRGGNANQGKLRIVYKGQGVRGGDAGMAGMAGTAGQKLLLEWQLELVTPQTPYLYSTTLHSVTVAASMSMPNAGTAFTYPTFTIATGGTDPIVITNTTTGKSLRLHVPVVPVPPGPLPAMPANLIVNFATRQITDLSGNPQNYVRDLTTQFFPLVPGANTVTVTSGGGAVTGSATYRDAWV